MSAWDSFKGSTRKTLTGVGGLLAVLLVFRFLTLSLEVEVRSKTDPDQCSGALFYREVALPCMQAAWFAYTHAGFNLSQSGFV